jgi:hypothetical protein
MPIIKDAAFAVLAVGLCLCSTVSARDSARYVCSAIVELRVEGGSRQIGISIDFFDGRAESGDARKYTLSSIYQGKLFQGTVIDRSDKFGQGRIALKNGRSELYVGSFKLEKQRSDSYAMSLDGMINDDPARGKMLYSIKTRLPCVDLSD